MRNEQCLEGDLRLEAIRNGIDVEALDKEFQEVGRTKEEAERIVRKRRGWIKHFIIKLWEDFPIPTLGYTNPEVQKEWDKLNEKQEKSSK